MKYRKRPVVIEAFKWTADIEQKEDPEWIVAAFNRGEVHIVRQVTTNEPMLVIKTLEGVMTAMVGDYVIKGTKGEIYPCKPDIFEEIYEKVEE